VTWAGPHRAPLVDAGVYPRALQDPLPVWIAVGGTPQSVVRAATLGLPLTIAIIGGEPARFAPLVQLYREAFAAGGPTGAELPPVGRNTHTDVAAVAATAGDEFFPHYGGMMSRIGRERGWPPMSRMQFDQLRSPRGAVLAGGPREVADKILYEHDLFGHQRFLAQMSVGGMPHDKVMRSIELFGTEVAPVVRAEVERRSAAAAAPTSA
jgi:alkanesulfonate monooxygenase SsuD/methylene tetrahydromethanopterin reductase-like flavin-dependent oxidoreductase (luciferase family)